MTTLRAGRAPAPAGSLSSTGPPRTVKARLVPAPVAAGVTTGRAEAVSTGSTNVTTSCAPVSLRAATSRVAGTRAP